MLISTTQSNLNCLYESSQWIADGTFSSVPVIFKQLYTLHGWKNMKMLPLVYILLPNKKKHLYTEALTVLKNHMPTLEPTRVMLDFQNGSLNAFKIVFPNAKIIGFLFHYSQCLWRNVQLTGLQRKYNTDTRFALNIRMLLALSFVPIDDVRSAFDQLVETKYYKDHEDELHGILDYFERTWIGVLSRSGKSRLKPYFALSLWNYYEAVINDLIRSNNAVERWHRSFNKKVRVAHASFNKFIDVIKSKQIKTDVLITQADTGLGIASKRRREYVDLEYRLKNIVLSYDRNKIIKYLHDIATILML
ncbi:uncharacterized protein LOC143264616 [Megachile rotundata]|uniref:uncharacterized protein LOC143264616 n=1 Tax=Megachile rotundata TaxID=143995 RepID=UPI003FD2900A